MIRHNDENAQIITCTMIKGAMIKCAYDKNTMIKCANDKRYNDK